MASKEAVISTISKTDESKPMMLKLQPQRVKLVRSSAHKDNKRLENSNLQHIGGALIAPTQKEAPKPCLFVTQGHWVAWQFLEPTEVEMLGLDFFKYNFYLPIEIVAGAVVTPTLCNPTQYGTSVDIANRISACNKQTATPVSIIGMDHDYIHAIANVQERKPKHLVFEFSGNAELIQIRDDQGILIGLLMPVRV